MSTSFICFYVYRESTKVICKQLDSYVYISKTDLEFHYFSLAIELLKNSLEIVAIAQSVFHLVSIWLPKGFIYWCFS